MKIIKKHHTYRILATAPAQCKQTLTGVVGTCVSVACRHDAMNSPVGLTHIPMTVEWGAYLECPSKPNLIWVCSWDTLEEVKQ